MVEEIKVHDGMISFRPKGHFLKKLKEHYAILFATSKSGMARIEFYENQSASCSSPYTLMIPGSDVIKVRMVCGNTNEEKNSFVIATRAQQHMFCTKKPFDCEIWVEKIQRTLLIPFQTPTAGAIQVKATPNECITDNDIYVPAVEMCREYTVTTGVETRMKLAVDGKVRLRVENGHITIISSCGNRIVRWPIEHLRRMGFTDSAFHIEAGRKSPVGEGKFVFITNEGKNIYSLIMKEKEVCRHIASKSQGTALPPGRIAAPSEPEPESLLFSGHIYEAVNDLIPQPPSIGNVTRPGFKENSLSGNPGKPPRISTTNNCDAHSPKPLSLSVVGQPTTSSGKSGDVKSQSSSHLPTMSATKSLPTNPASTFPSTDMQSLSNYQQHTHPESSIYSEAIIPTEAWKGWDDDETMPECAEATYDSLRHFTPMSKQLEEDHYNYTKPAGGGEKVDKGAKRVQQQQPIYAEVHKPKWSSHKKN